MNENSPRVRSVRENLKLKFMNCEKEVNVPLFSMSLFKVLYGTPEVSKEFISDAIDVLSEKALQLGRTIESRTTLSIVFEALQCYNFYLDYAVLLYYHANMVEVHRKRESLKKRGKRIFFENVVRKNPKIVSLVSENIFVDRHREDTKTLLSIFYADTRFYRAEFENFLVQTLRKRYDEWSLDSAINVIKSCRNVINILPESKRFIEEVKGVIKLPEIEALFYVCFKTKDEEGVRRIISIYNYKGLFSKNYKEAVTKTHRILFKDSVSNAENFLDSATSCFLSYKKMMENFDLSGTWENSFNLFIRENEEIASTILLEKLDLILKGATWCAKNIVHVVSFLKRLEKPVYFFSVYKDYTANRIRNQETTLKEEQDVLDYVKQFPESRELCAQFKVVDSYYSDCVFYLSSDLFDELRFSEAHAYKGLESSELREFNESEKTKVSLKVYSSIFMENTHHETVYCENTFQLIKNLYKRLLPMRTINYVASIVVVELGFRGQCATIRISFVEYTVLSHLVQCNSIQKALLQSRLEDSDFNSALQSLINREVVLVDGDTPSLNTNRLFKRPLCRRQ